MSLYKINKDNTTLSSEISPTSFASEGLKEREHLQNWFKDKIDVIASDIKVIAEEFCDWEDSSRRIDLLAIDNNANIVVIELKRTEDRGHMELQAIRYAAMASNMTWDKAVDTFREYRKKHNIKGDAESELLKFLGWTDDTRKEEFGKQVRIILVGHEFNKDITTSVLWLNENGLDITCVRLSLQKPGNDLLLNVEQIIPLPQAKDYQIKVKAKKQEEQAVKIEKRDYAFIISKLERECSVHIIKNKGGKSFYESDSKLCRFVIATSNRHKNGFHLFSYSPNQKEYLYAATDREKSFLVLGCLDIRKIFEIPLKDLEGKILDHVSQNNEDVFLINIFQKETKSFIRTHSSAEPIDITAFEI